MKSAAKSLIARILGNQVRRLTKKNDFKVVAVAGSIGKTSTKLAIAHVLGQDLRVRYQDGNYNDLVTVPLIFFNRNLPSLFNPLAWLITFIKNEIDLLKPYPYDVVVVELGTDGPGQIKQFGKYIKADIGVLTSIAPEHMEYFADLDAVAHEELKLASMVKRLLINKDLIDSRYASELADKPLTYAINQTSDYQLTDINFGADSASYSIKADDKLLLKLEHQVTSEPQLYSILAAAAVADLLNVDAKFIKQGITSLPGVPGRMRTLPGINDSTIIDDTYNASPQATKAALDTLYRMQAPQKIAVLGNMNELGKYSDQEHKAIGNYVEPGKVDLVLTIGPDANKYIAPAAKQKGVSVMSFENPFLAGEYLRLHIKVGAIILVKGSQNKVFAEETVKLILTNPQDVAKLVRQSAYWLEQKRKNFPTLAAKYL